MFDFFRDSLKRKAFNKALLEVELEDAHKEKVKHTKDTSISRVYTGEVKEEVTQGSYKFKSVLSRPQTTAVDLKNFKDWRKVDKVESNQPKWEPKPSFKDEISKLKKESDEDIKPKFVPKKPSFIDDDDGAEPSIESPVDFIRPASSKSIFEEEPKQKPAPSFSITARVERKPEVKKQEINLVDKLFSPTDAQTKDKNISTYLREEKKKAVSNMSLEDMVKTLSPSAKPNDKNTVKVEVVNFDEKKPLEAKPRSEAKPQEIKKEDKKLAISLDQMSSIIRNNEKKEAPKPVAPAKPEVKSEQKTVVKTEPKKPATKKKATTSDAPKKKSRKRFDADVVSGISWK